ncbi:MAG: sialate O-acetylesterase [Planctomycetes bacterium]|nr:sialate O-acetylesterase [Planctomycetota bacterium]
MMRPNRSILVCCLALLLAAAGALVRPAAGDVRLPHIIGDHMVLQRGVPIPIWGWAEPGEAVTVTLGEQVARTTADESGEWIVRLPALPAGGPHEMTVAGRNSLAVVDILIGEVWLCSGQSNMEMGVGVSMDAEKEIASADHPRMRLFELPRNPAGEPVRDIDAVWRTCSPKTIADGWWGGFSAVGYYFGRHLHKELGVPIGLIDSTWGGTRIEPWTPPCGFAAVPKLRSIADEIARRVDEYKTQQLPAKLAELEAWIAATRAALDSKSALPRPLHWPQHPLANEREPTGLYNGMVHPLVPLALRGAIWYQGESNVHTDDGMMYFEKMKALIGGWREVWGQGDFPFYFVQLAPFKYTLHNKDIRSDQLPRIWEAQFAALRIPQAGMAVLTDLGDWRDIHPQNKQEVGRRLALWALANTYGQDNLVCSGPLFKAMAVENGKIRVRFAHVGGGLKSRDGQPLNWFEIAAADKQYVPAAARIDGDTVLVWSEDVPQPVAVRFAWHMLPEPIPNLVNAEGLPASPFRTHRDQAAAQE